VAQGFTTEVINPDGLAPAPVAEGGHEGRDVEREINSCRKKGI
jgi:hypothetical protein